jgi:glutathionylspermidine synthase
MKVPWRTTEPLEADSYAQFRRRAIFDLCKWDVQIEDVPALADFALVLEASAAAEEELARRPELHGRLGLPRGVRNALAVAGTAGPARGAARLVRFDFHFTTEGWRISEANSDVPGGLNEAAGLPRLLPSVAPGLPPAGDPAAAYAEALHREAGPNGVVALVHATGYSDDRQVMVFLARELESRSLATRLVSPEHVTFRDGRAFVRSEWANGPVDLLVRFFPAEWLPNLASREQWLPWFAGGRTPASNPATGLLVQTKRFPLVWDDLETDLSGWRALLPETRDPRDVGGDALDRWVLKPALGRVGEGIGIAGTTPPREWRTILREVRRRPEEWVAQRRFEIVSTRVGESDVHPCIGVYTIDGRAAGAYGRVAAGPLVDHRARDAAVLVASAEGRISAIGAASR